MFAYLRMTSSYYYLCVASMCVRIPTICSHTYYNLYVLAYLRMTSSYYYLCVASIHRQ